ncbi:MAG TPA: cysteine hydrolase family protein [Thermoanaerobaculaceae bacterium]|nr:cysteine hydrolase family protein [Thermoanaerobaculaceae bacterium]
MSNAIVGWVLAATLAGVVAAAQGTGATTGGPDTALVVIDIQEFYFEGGRLPLVNPVAASEQARKVLDRFRAKRWPVIHVQHLPKSQTTPSPNAGDPQYRIHPNVLPVAGETVIGKHYANAFRDTDLEATLKRLGVTKLVICGMQTHMCVEATARAAADLGYDVTVVHDACATRDLSFGGTTVPAAQVHAAALAALANSYGRIVSTDELLGQLN